MLVVIFALKNNNIMSTKHKFITTVEVAKLLSISRGRVYTLVSKKAIPYYKPSGGRLLFDREEIAQWITKGKGGCV